MLTDLAIAAAQIGNDAGPSRTHGVRVGGGIALSRGGAAQHTTAITWGCPSTPDDQGNGVDRQLPNGWSGT
jgi:hypothetical protein